MNILLAIAILTGVFMVNYSHPAYLEKPVDVAYVDENSPAAAAGLKAGDRIIRIDDKHSPTWEEFMVGVYLRAPEPVSVAVQRGTEVLSLTLRPKGSNAEEGILQLGLRPEKNNVVNDVDANLPAFKAGIQKGDEILALNGTPTPDMFSVRQYLQTNGDKEVTVTVKRDGKDIEYKIVPVLSEVEGEPNKIYRLGFSAQPSLHVDKLSFSQALRRSLDENKKNSLLIGTMLKKLATREVSIKKMDGPLGIMRETDRASRQPGWSPLLYLMAIISLNLGIFNLLPIPILDGGLILLTTIEGVMRRDINQRLKERIYQTAFVFLILFAVIVMYNDVTKLSIFN